MAKLSFQKGWKTIISQTKVSEKSGNLEKDIEWQSWSTSEIPLEPQHEISNNVVYATSKGSDQPAHMHSLIRAFASRLNIL